MFSFVEFYYMHMHGCIYLPFSRHKSDYEDMDLTEYDEDTVMDGYEEASQSNYLTLPMIL